MSRRWLKIGAPAALLALGTVLGGIAMCEAFLHPGPVSKAPDAKRLGDPRPEDVEIRARDGVTLRGWFFSAPQRQGRAVIVLHGQGDNRGGAAGFAKMFLARGYDVLTPDSRAHGSSGGTFATYGLFEADDVKRWAEWLTAARQERHIYGLGESMGAAIVLSAAGGGAPFDAVVAESPFSTLREIAYDRIPGGLGRTLLRPVVEVGFLWARYKYGIEPEAISPQQGAVRARMPILLIHGLADGSIPPAHSRRIRAATGGRASLWEVAGAGHTGASSREPAEFERRVFAQFQAANERE